MEAKLYIAEWLDRHTQENFCKRFGIKIWSYNKDYIDVEGTKTFTCYTEPVFCSIQKVKKIVVLNKVILDQ